MAHALLEELKRKDQLPSAPGVALRILELNRNEQVSVEELTRVLAQDPALVVKVLKAANSSLFGVTREISNLRQAILILGMRGVNLLALSFSLTGNLGKGKAKAFDYKRFWARSVTTALAARALGERRGYSADECFLGGMLCDLGMLILAEAIPERYAAIARSEASGRALCAAEERALGLSHADVGGEVLDHWGFPVSVCHAVGAHHAPETLEAQAGPAFQIACVLAVASSIGDALCGDDLAGSIERVRSDAQRWLSLAPEACGQVLEEVQAQLPELAQLLAIQIGSPDQLLSIRTQAIELLVRESMVLDQQVQNVTSKVHALESEKQDLELRATTDPLTGLRNRGFFDESLAAALEEARRRGRPLGLLLLDLDRFKSVNDEYGHTVGDELLRAVGRAVAGFCRMDEVACRYGGEEVTLILPVESEAELVDRAQSLRSAIGAIRVETPRGPVRRTASIGAAFVPLPRGHTPGEVIEAADRALYRAKGAGRDRVVASTL